MEPVGYYFSSSAGDLPATIKGQVKMEKFKVKRIYDEPADIDGYRVLVDRL
jgi:hypothetical protein